MAGCLLSSMTSKRTVDVKISGVDWREEVFGVYQNQYCFVMEACVID